MRQLFKAVWLILTKLKIDQRQQEDEKRQCFYRTATVVTGDNDVNPNFLFICLSIKRVFKKKTYAAVW